MKIIEVKYIPGACDTIDGVSASNIIKVRRNGYECTGGGHARKITGSQLLAVLDNDIEVDIKGVKDIKQWARLTPKRLDLIRKAASEVSVKNFEKETVIKAIVKNIKED